MKFIHFGDSTCTIYFSGNMEIHFENYATNGIVK